MTTKTLTEQEKAERKAIREAIETTRAMYVSDAKIESVTRIVKEAITYSRASDDDCRDAYFFQAFRLWEDKAYGEHKTKSDYIKAMGVTDASEIKIVNNRLNYMAGRGKILVKGESPTKTRATRDASTRLLNAFAKLETPEEKVDVLRQAIITLPVDDMEDISYWLTEQIDLKIKAGSEPVAVNG